MSKNSIQIIYNKFSWDNYGQVVEFYEQIYKKNNDKPKIYYWKKIIKQII